MPTYYSSTEFSTIRSRALQQLEELFSSHRIPPSHGLDHAQLVASHMVATVVAHEAQEPGRVSPLSKARQFALFLAALLHDADDAKYFAKPDTGSKMVNSARISTYALENVESKQDIVAEVVEMISYVSMSGNGNSVPTRAVSAPEFLWPRFCDRLEAIGTIGIIRTFQYNREKAMRLSSTTTPCPKHIGEVWQYVTPERVEAYCANGSASMMDHVYDKLLQIPSGFTPDIVQNCYLVATATRRVQPLLELCVEYGRTGQVPVGRIEALIREEGFRSLNKEVLAE